MKPFDYYSPTTLEDARHVLVDYGAEARALAGGTDLLIRIKRRQWTPRAVVNLKRIPGLRDISLNGELRLGALVTLSDLIRSPIICEHFPVLAHTASRMAGVQVRNIATVGGNLCNASPAADTAPSLIALGARAVIVGGNGERAVPLDEFFAGAGVSVLAPDEILREILVPRDAASTSYAKLEHREAMGIAIVGVGVSLKIPNPRHLHRTHTLYRALWACPEAVPKGVQVSKIPNCQDVRIVLGAVAPTPMRAKRAEEILRGQPLTEERIAKAARVAAEEAKPIDDVRGSAWYRREMVEVLTRRQLMKIIREK